MKPSIRNLRKPTASKPREQGYVLLMVLFLLTLMIIAMAASVPAAKTALKRDKENELIHRGNQYARAIGRYYRRFGRYPASIEQLENTNNMRFLRKRYKDPMTGKDDWILLHFGEVQLQTPGLIGAGAGNPSGFGSPPGSSMQNSPSSRSNSSTPDQVGTAGTKDNPGGLGNRRFGGGPIVGVASSKEDESLKELNGKDHYNEWQFVYDPTRDPTARGRTGIPGQQGIPGATPAGQPGQFGPGVSPQGGPGGPGTMGGPGTTTPTIPR